MNYLKLFLLIIVVIGIYFLSKNTLYDYRIDLLVTLVIGICLYYLHQNPLIEGMDDIKQAQITEAIANIASIYNNDQMTVKNLKVTGELQVDGKNTVKDTDITGKLNIVGPTNITGQLNVTGNQLTTGYIIAKDRIFGTLFHRNCDDYFSFQRNSCNEPIAMHMYGVNADGTSGGWKAKPTLTLGGLTVDANATVNGKLRVGGSSVLIGGVASGGDTEPGGQTICRKKDGSWSNVGSCGW